MPAGTKSLTIVVLLGYLESLDDFYQLSSGLVMLQTTNSIFNTDLYDLVKPQSLFAWQRVRVANMMAHSGQEWYSVVRMYNSGVFVLYAVIYKIGSIFSTISTVADTAQCSLLTL